MSEGKTLQDVMSSDLFAGSKGEMVETLYFMERHAVPLSDRQVAGMAMLQYLDSRRGQKTYKPIVDVLTKHAKDMAKPGVFIDVIEALTLADRIKGNVRLNNIFKGEQK
jgi:hypothetical protein